MAKEDHIAFAETLHDDSGFSIALFERAATRIKEIESTELLDAGMARTLGRWLDRTPSRMRPTYVSPNGGAPTR